VQNANPVHHTAAALKTGTDNAALSMQPNGAPSMAVNYDQLDTPAVWRSSRESAAARVSALEESGMDRLEIPAFLRKQAD
jgi:cell division protein FtsZ